MSVKDQESLPDKVRKDVTLKFWEIISREGMVSKYAGANKLLSEFDFKMNWIRRSYEDLRNDGHSHNISLQLANALWEDCCNENHY